MQIAILAGGQATRLGYLTLRRPKSMIKIQGKPFLEYQLGFLKEGGITDAVMCTGFMGEQIERYCGDGSRFGLNILYSNEDRPLGTAGALKKAEPLLDNVFFTIYGDSYIFLDFSTVMSYFKSYDKLGLMTVYQNCDRHDRSNTAVKGNLVTKFSKTEKAEDSVYIEYGANIFRKEVLELVPKDKFYSLEELFQELIKQEELLAFEVTERFYEIGSLQGLGEFETFVRRQRA